MPKPQTIHEYKRQREAAQQLSELGRKMVSAWVDANFEPGCVTIKPESMPGLPGATWVVDSGGERLLAWYDIFADQVRWR